MNQAGPCVTAVIVAYRHVDDVVRCVASLDALEQANLRVVVVDNTESPEIREQLQASLPPRVQYQYAGGNLGFAAANNLAIAQALELDADFIWLVNPDSAVEPGTLNAFLAAAQEHPDAGIFGSRILYGDTWPSVIWFDGGMIDLERGGATWHRHHGRLDADLRKATRVDDVGYVTGASFFMRAQVARTVGLMTEDYFLYYEETDYCLRAQAAGWRTVHVPLARTWHDKRSGVELPTPYFIYYSIRNRLVFASRFTQASEQVVLESLEPFIQLWRSRVEQLAPGWLGVYQQLVEMAVTDGKARRMGPRAEVSALPAPVPSPVPAAAMAQSAQAQNENSLVKDGAADG